MSESLLAEVSRALARCEDPAEIQAFLESWLTPRERADLDLRWRLVQKLEEGHTQRLVVQELGTSLCKVTRGAKELKRADSPFRRMLARSRDPLPGSPE